MRIPKLKKLLMLLCIHLITVEKITNIRSFSLPLFIDFLKEQRDNHERTTTQQQRCLYYKEAMATSNTSLLEVEGTSINTPYVVDVEHDSDDEVSGLQGVSIEKELRS